MPSDQPGPPNVVRFMRACTTGDTEAVRTLLAEEPALARERLTGGTTGLHLAGPHPDVVRVLLAHGADPNARDGGDNATPLHFAAAQGNVDSVRLLLDAGADVRGMGDVHNGEVIGCQLATSRARLAGSDDSIDVHFDEDLYEPFYGGRQFSLRDNNGLSVIFFQPHPVPSDATSIDGAENAN